MAEEHTSEFKAGQVVYSVPGHECFCEAKYPACRIHPERWAYTWIVGPDGEFYRKIWSPDQESATIWHTRKCDFRATWMEAMEESLLRCVKQAELIRDTIKEDATFHKD